MKIQKVIAKINEKIGLLFLGKYLEYDFKSKNKNTYLNERSIEYEFVLKNLLEHKCLDVLDVGTGSNSFSSALEHCGYNMTATDLKQGSYWASFSNRHIHVVRDDITKSKLNKKYDAILCISVLEHIPVFEEAVKGMVDLLKDDGVLIITFPYSHNNYCENVYKLDEADEIAKKFRYIGQSFSKNEIDLFCKNNTLEIADTQFGKGWSGEYWRTGDRYDFPVKVDDPNESNIGCFLFNKLAEK